jgi:hypothetical protein
MNQGYRSSERAAELAALRAALLSALQDTCTVSRNTTSANGAGGQSAAWTTVFADLPCHLESEMRRGFESSLGDRQEFVTKFRMHVPAETDIRIADRVLHAGVTYDVVDLEAPLSQEPLRSALLNAIR